MNFYEVMTDLSDAIRSHTGKNNRLNLDDQIKELSNIFGYEQNFDLPNSDSVSKFIILADILRYGLKLSRKITLPEMPELIRSIGKKSLSNGRALYDDLAAAIAECDDGGTVTLLKDIDVGNLSNIFIDKSITLDGRGHTLTRDLKGGHLLIINENGVTLAVKNLKSNFNSSADKALIHSNEFSANLYLENCEIDSNEVVVYFRKVDGSIVIKNSVIKSKEQAFQFNYCTGDIELLNSEIYGGSVNDATLHLYYSSPAISIDQSQIIGSYAPAISLRYSDASLLVSKSYLQSGNTLYGAIDIHNCSPIVDLKNSTKIWIDSLTNASIRMRGSSNCDPIITLYDSVMLTEGLEGHIYYTTYGERTGFHVRFATDYSGPAFTAMSTWDSSKNCVLALRYSLPEAAESYSYVLVNRDVDYTMPIVLENHATYVQSAVTIDVETGYEASSPRRIYYNGDGSMFCLQYYDDPDYANYFTHLELNDLYLLADHGTVFYFESGKIHTYIRDCITEGQKILTGFTSEDIFITYDVATRDALVAEGHYVETLSDQNSIAYYNVVR